MPRIVRIDPTPNPRALKFITDALLADPPRSYRSPAEAPPPDSDPLAAALFAIPGVSSVLLSGNWVTVNSAGGADLATLKDGARRAIESVGSQQHPSAMRPQ